MDRRIFNVHTWSFLSMRIHTGDGHTDESAQQFWLEKKKNSQICLVLLTGFEPWVFGSPRVRRSTNWATPSPQWRLNILVSLLHHRSIQIKFKKNIVWPLLLFLSVLTHLPTLYYCTVGYKQFKKTISSKIHEHFPLAWVCVRCCILATSPKTPNVKVNLMRNNELHCQ